MLLSAEVTTDAAEGMSDATEGMTDAAEVMRNAAEIPILSGKRPAKNCRCTPDIRFPRSVVAKYLQSPARLTQGRKATQFPRKLAIRSRKIANTRSPVADDDEE